VQQPTYENIIFLPINQVCVSYSTQLKSMSEDSWDCFQRPLLQAGGEIKRTNKTVENAASPSLVTDIDVVLCLI